MYDIIPSGPEAPDPAQLTLFDNGANPGEDPTEGPDNGTNLSIELHNRSPTPEASALNDAQQQLAGSLHRKSRELVLKSFQRKNEENDLAR